MFNLQKRKQPPSNSLLRASFESGQCAECTVWFAILHSSLSELACYNHEKLTETGRGPFTSVPSNLAKGGRYKTAKVLKTVRLSSPNPHRKSMEMHSGYVLVS